MIVAIDIGNTSVTVGLVKGKRTTETFFIKNASNKNVFLKDLKALLKNIKKKKLFLESAWVCSVVPKLNLVIDREVKLILGLNTFVAGKDVQVPVKNNYDNPKEVGLDRLVGAYAAKCLYGSPAIIIDLGTAITIDVVNKKGAYEGGMIIPGIRLSAESLFLKTALLPSIRSIHRPKKIVGKNTEDSILSGIFFGYGAMCSGLIKTLQEKKSLKQAKVIMTGGYTHMMKKYIGVKIDKIDENLVLTGLSLLSKET